MRFVHLLKAKVAREIIEATTIVAQKELKSVKNHEFNKL